MQMSKLYMPTLREAPAEAEVESHKLLLRAGMIRRSASGIYSYLPLGYRVVRKIENIVREEMNRSGSQEVLMSAIQPKEIWEASGRWLIYGPEMFKLKDRNNREFCLGPTAEEYFTTLIKNEVKSYKQLPLNLYQIQTKYRDEKRPRFGINRAREFLMKDAYTFDINREKMLISYYKMHKTYCRIFDRLGFDYRVVKGDSGAMGGNSSHEYIALAEDGEGVICFSKNNNYAATDEKAKVYYRPLPKEFKKDLEEVYTPGVSTIDDVIDFLGVDHKKCAKAIDLTVSGEPVLVFIPGDRELNIIKLSSYLEVPVHDIEMMSNEDIINRLKSYPGFTGPIGIPKDVRVIIDRSLTLMNNLVVGANKKDFHYINVCFGRDFDCEVASDLLMIQEGDLDKDGNKLEFARGIEVGNIFQLGTKYSKALKATYLDKNGKEQLIWMGSYGIGITRSVSAVVEQNHDENGIIWPILISPYHVVITIINMNDSNQINLAKEIYERLSKKGIEVLIDDRKERPGVKFNDRDLIGIPLRLTIGKKSINQIVEFSTRKDRQDIYLNKDEAVSQIIKYIKNKDLGFLL